MNRARILGLFVFCVFGAVTSAPAQTVPMPPEFKPVREYIEDSIQKGIAPSVALAVVKEDKVIWAEGFGFADRERHIKATPDTMYWLASVSKLLTATGMMTLVENGLIDLDRPANDYLPGAKLRSYAGDAKQMTVRRLANHTSGLPVHYNFYYAGTPPLSSDEVIGRYGIGVTAPGSRWEYSNLAFGILAHIVELAAKKPWREFQAAAVYRPLRMTRTWDGVPRGRDREAAVPYTRDVGDRFIRVPLYDFDHRGASAIWSTANDLARFVRANLNGGVLEGTRILKEESVRAMHRLSGESAPGVGTGIGWAVGLFMGHESISHTGGMPGVATYVRAYPKDNAATIVLTNIDDSTIAVQVTTRLAGVLFSDARMPQRTEHPAPAETKSPSVPALAGTWEGKLAHFDGEIALRLTVKEDGTGEVSFGNRRPSKLNDLTLTEQGLRGRTQGMLRTQDGYYGTPDLGFVLGRDGDRLTGICVASAPRWFSLSHWVELKKSANVP